MSRALLQRYVKVASRAAVEAGGLLARHIGRPRTVTTKRSAIDLVTEIDRASERLIYRILHRAEPAFGFLGEEQGERREAAECRWIVDPLDGTNNFVHGFPFFGVSIGLECDGAMAAGVIYDPLRRELFTASAGAGAFCNGRRIRVSATRRLAESLLSTGFSSKFLTQDQPYLNWFRKAQRNSHGVRRLGSTVISLASVACGRLEGFYEQDLWPWDLAAGLVLVQEAGGRVSDAGGRPVRLTAGQLVASNGHIHRELLRLLTLK
ncbi:MAG: inositol monophosphatase [Candidatus Omnitrophica bacterium]|nr:inositol monophosphatase [Candidatus Omnitrophota bacterium]